MAWPQKNGDRQRVGQDPEDTRARAQEKHERGDQDSSADGARKIAQDVEDQGGFWGPRSK